MNTSLTHAAGRQGYALDSEATGACIAKKTMTAFSFALGNISVLYCNQEIGPIPHCGRGLNTFPAGGNLGELFSKQKTTLISVITHYPLVVFLVIDPAKKKYGIPSYFLSQPMQ